MLRKYILILILMFLVTGCQTTELITAVASDESKVLEVKGFESRRHASTLLGAIELSKPNPPSCDRAVNKVIIKRDIIDGLLYFFFAPFYTTRTIQMYCN